MPLQRTTFQKLYGCNYNNIDWKQRGEYSGNLHCDRAVYTDVQGVPAVCSCHRNHDGSDSDIWRNYAELFAKAKSGIQ